MRKKSSTVVQSPPNPTLTGMQTEQPRSPSRSSARPRYELWFSRVRSVKPNDEENPAGHDDGRWPNSPPKYPPGYPRVAGFMACGANSAIFKKFDRMAYASFLQQQAQLLNIEREIDDMNAMDEELLRLQSCIKGKGKTQADAASKPKDNAEAAEELFQDFLAGPGTVSEGKARISTETTEEQKWVHLVYKMQCDAQGDLKSQSYTALRGVWEVKSEGLKIVAFSLVFPPESTVQQPILMLDSSINSSRYTRAASWEINIAGTRIQDISPARRCIVGADFNKLLWEYASRTKKGEHTERTVHMFARWRTNLYEKGDKDVFLLVTCFNPREQTTLLDASLFTPMDRRTSNATKRFEQFTNLIGPPTRDSSMSSREFPQELVGPLRLMIARRHNALRDAGLMAKSQRQENIEHVNALNRLELMLANYSECISFDNASIMTPSIFLYGLRRKKKREKEKKKKKKKRNKKPMLIPS